MKNQATFEDWARRVKENVDYFSERAKGFDWRGRPLTETKRLVFKARLQEALADWELACSVARKNGIKLPGMDSD